MKKNPVWLNNSKEYWFWTLVTWDWLSSTADVSQIKEETALLVRAILETWWEVLINLAKNAKTNNILANTSYLFSSNVLNVRENIDKYLVKFKKFLQSYNFPEKYVDNAYKKMWYELFFSWMENLLVSCWFKIPDKFINVPENLKKEISNILRFDDELASLLIFMKKCGLIEISKNAWNEFEEESELKILEVNKNDLSARLEELWAERTLVWTVTDSYYEFPDWRFDKYKQELWESISFRLREKMDIIKDWNVTMYYTIKRKRQRNIDPIFRVCNEKELEILNYTKVLQLLEKFWLKKDRVKLKHRTSYLIKDKDDPEIWVKFDIDDYGTVEFEWKKVSVPTIVEIETNSRALAEYYIGKLWLEWNVKLAHWSRSLFRYYLEKEEKVKKDKKTKENKTKENKPKNKN